MMYRFLANNHDELIRLCADKVAKRPFRNATAEQLRNGIPLFLDQLTRTLEAEQYGDAAGGLKISGASGGGGVALSEMGVSAAAHGTNLLRLGYTVDQVVHDYGDLCQAITELALERTMPFTISEYQTLNRCMDNGIADAVTAFSLQRDTILARRNLDEADQREVQLTHELHDSVETAILAATVLELGKLALDGATGAILKRSLSRLKVVLDESISKTALKDSAKH